MTKKKTGRKPLWEKLDIPSKLEAVQGWAKQGSTDEEICKMIGISHDTFYKWKREKAEFAEAIKKGKEISNGELINSAFKQATGYYYVEQQPIKIKIGKDKEEVKVVEITKYATPNPTMNIFMLKNRLPDQYKEKQHVDVNINKKLEDFFGSES
ncbi:helix-turn-helix domain-containing protein [Marinisporobacter balticus]|uniref:Uncharacterized protein n=1 Tax=Marinisporobacter balticus TaxID=2018667 RepID=A0A4R2KYY9_9FIRM|nr:helix-turn-helix domain-containing protein [Marinisporobacter balticus]TCO79123.1 hypothetical protein EV214_103175 [Marinisporobacter balticus]